MAKFLVDENVPLGVVSFLQERGFDVKGVHELGIHPPLISEINRSFDQFLLKFDLQAIRGRLIILQRNGFRVG